MSPIIKLKFSEKYDQQHATQYLIKHQDGLARRLSHKRDEQLARRALQLAGEPQVVLDLPCGAGRMGGRGQMGINPLPKQHGRRENGAGHQRRADFVHGRMDCRAGNGRQDGGSLSDHGLPAGFGGVAQGMADKSRCHRS